MGVLSRMQLACMVVGWGSAGHRVDNGTMLLSMPPKPCIVHSANNLSDAVGSPHSHKSHSRARDTIHKIAARCQFIVASPVFRLGENYIATRTLHCRAGAKEVNT